MKNFFVILGGMGTLATNNFLNDLNSYYKPNCDQEYLNYLVFNNASIPDRTAYILNKNLKNPFEYLAEDIKQAEKLKPDFFVITCNTAHYFFNDLQKLTKIPIINMIELLEEELKMLSYKSKIGLFATRGTIKSGLYKSICNRNNLEIIENSEELQNTIDSVLYEDVKNKGIVDFEKYHKVLEMFLANGVTNIIIGCTEASYVNSLDKEANMYPLIDTEKLLAKESVKRALNLRNK